MISKEEIAQARAFLEKASNPLFIYDRDTDGFSAYLLLRRFCKMKGAGLMMQTGPKLDVDFLSNVQEHHADLIIILDVPLVSQDFLNKMVVPVLWFDHHPLQERKKVYDYNPRKENEEDNRPTTVLAWAVVEQDEWTAAVGCLADWYIPDFLN